MTYEKEIQTVAVFSEPSSPTQARSRQVPDEETMTQTDEELEAENAQLDKDIADEIRGPFSFPSGQVGLSYTLS